MNNTQQQTTTKQQQQTTTYMLLLIELTDVAVFLFLYFCIGQLRNWLWNGKGRNE